MKLPELVVHCDWSKSETKRWMARALLSETGYSLSAPEPVGSTGDFLTRVRASVGLSATIVVGFDFPIGIPSAYAERAGVRDFKPFLGTLGRGRWAQFYEVACEAEEISIHRPFYPVVSSAGARQVHLLKALGLDDPRQLYRVCERPHAGRPKAACSLFWTLGANQVGRGAITGWREILNPAVANLDEEVCIWPFDGAFASLVNAPRTIIVETYPGEVYAHLGIQFESSESKLRQSDRRLKAKQLASWAARRGLAIESDLAHEIRDGFGPYPGGDDRFDAVIGLFGMLEVILENREEGHHPDTAAGRVEGWIFGQTIYSLN